MVTRALVHEPLGWRPTLLVVTIRRYRCPGCGHVWRQDFRRAAHRGRSRFVGVATAPAPATDRQKPSTAASSTSAAPRSGSATSPTTSPDHYSKAEVQTPTTPPIVKRADCFGGEPCGLWAPLRPRSTRCLCYPDDISVTERTRRIVGRCGLAVRSWRSLSGGACLRRRHCRYCPTRRSSIWSRSCSSLSRVLARSVSDMRRACMSRTAVAWLSSR
jgi:hypothetical protein